MTPIDPPPPTSKSSAFGQPAPNEALVAAHLRRLERAVAKPELRAAVLDAYEANDYGARYGATRTRLARMAAARPALRWLSARPARPVGLSAAVLSAAVLSAAVAVLALGVGMSFLGGRDSGRIDAAGVGAAGAARDRPDAAPAGPASFNQTYDADLLLVEDLAPLHGLETFDRVGLSERSLIADWGR